MRAALVHHTDAPLGVAKDDQILAEHARLDRRAVGLDDFLGQANRCPMAAHQLAHRGIALDSTQQLVLLYGQHTCTLQ